MLPSHDGDPALTQLILEIIAEYAPSEVWLFGSRAEGRAAPDSDYDLLVILDPRADEADALVRAWKVGARCNVRADIIPCTLSAFVLDRDVVDTLPYASCEADDQSAPKPLRNAPCNEARGGALMLNKHLQVTWLCRVHHAEVHATKAWTRQLELWSAS